MKTEDITRRFDYHPPRSVQRRNAHEDVRSLLRDVAHELNHLLPDGEQSREKEHAIAKLEEAQFWANAALARCDDPNATVSREEAGAGPPDLG